MPSVKDDGHDANIENGIGENTNVPPPLGRKDVEGGSGENEVKNMNLRLQAKS